MDKPAVAKQLPVGADCGESYAVAFGEAGGYKQGVSLWVNFPRSKLSVIPFLLAYSQEEQ